MWDGLLVERTVTVIAAATVTGASASLVPEVAPVATWFGAIKPSVVMAGFVGAIVMCSVIEDVGWKKAWTAIAAGTALATFATTLTVRALQKWLLGADFGMVGELEGFVAFLLGVGGYFLVPWIANAFKDPKSLIDWWRSKGGGTGTGGDK